jgi:hypothetical protein
MWPANCPLSLCVAHSGCVTETEYWPCREWAASGTGQGGTESDRSMSELVSDHVTRRVSHGRNPRARTAATDSRLGEPSATTTEATARITSARAAAAAAGRHRRDVPWRAAVAADGTGGGCPWCQQGMGEGGRGVHRLGHGPLMPCMGPMLMCELMCRLFLVAR